MGVDWNSQLGAAIFVAYTKLAFLLRLRVESSQNQLLRIRVHVVYGVSALVRLSNANLLVQAHAQKK